MRSTGIRKFLTVSAAAALVAGAGILAAQPDGDQVSAAELPEVGDAGESLSPKQARASASNILQTLRDKLEHLVELRKLARSSEDILKLNCVNDKLLLYKQAVNLAEEAQTDLVEAIAGGDEPARHHQYRQIIRARDRAVELRRAAEECIGAELAFIGPTDLDVTSPPIDDLYPHDWFDLDDPKYATPFN